DASCTTRERAEKDRGRLGEGGGTRGCGLKTAEGGFSPSLFATAAHKHRANHASSSGEHVLVLVVLSRGLPKNGRLFFLGVYRVQCKTTSYKPKEPVIFGMFHLHRKEVSKGVRGKPGKPTTPLPPLAVSRPAYVIANPNSRATTRRVTQNKFTPSTTRGGFRGSLPRRRLILNTDSPLQHNRHPQHPAGRYQQATTTPRRRRS
ncbi:unnamed protein product, partial [Ectocarpus fasciculatus]